MSQDMERLLRKYVKDLQQMYGSRLKTVILYGSYASGDLRAVSDIDLMI